MNNEHDDESDNNAILRDVADRLKSGGYDGLYWGGVFTDGCACVLDDLAPCGNVERDDDGYINGCRPGYKHCSTRRPELWIVSSIKDSKVDDKMIHQLNDEPYE